MGSCVRVRIVAASKLILGELSTTNVEENLKEDGDRNQRGSQRDLRFNLSAAISF